MSEVQILLLIVSALIGFDIGFFVPRIIRFIRDGSEETRFRNRMFYVTERIQNYVRSYLKYTARRIIEECGNQKEKKEDES